MFCSLLGPQTTQPPPPGVPPPPPVRNSSMRNGTPTAGMILHTNLFKMRCLHFDLWVIHMKQNEVNSFSIKITLYLSTVWYCFIVLIFQVILTQDLQMYSIEYMNFHHQKNSLMCRKCITAVMVRQFNFMVLIFLYNIRLNVLVLPL